MSYFYVKSGFGTRTTGGGTTKQTGSMAALGAANVYNSIPDAIADGAGSADDIMCSHLHDYTLAATNISHAGPNGNSDVFLTIISVDDAAIDTFKEGAKERTSSSSTVDMILTGMISYWGVTIECVDDLLMNTSGAQLRFHKSTIKLLNAGSTITFAQDGCLMELYDTVIDYGDATIKAFAPSRGSTIYMQGGAITSSAGGDGFVNQLTSEGFQNGGGAVYLMGTDLSIIDLTVFKSVGAANGSDDRMFIRMDLCKMHANVAFFDEEIDGRDVDIEISRCSSSSSSAEYQYYRKMRGGSVEDATDITRDGSEAYADSAQKVSRKVITDSRVQIASPVVFELPSIWAELTAAGTDTLRVNLLCSETLTDQDVWIEVVAPDKTNKHEANISASGNVITGSFAQDPLAAGTGLDTNTEAWTGRTSENRYHIDINTSTAEGWKDCADCVPRILVHVTKPNLSSGIYFDTEPVLVAA